MIDYSYQQAMQVRRHKRVPENELPYGCSVCGRQFATSAQLGVHSKYHSDTRKETSLSSPVHSTHASNTRPFSCHECGKGFYQSSNLDSHLHVHTGKVLYKCKICQKPFSLRSALVKHVRHHSSSGTVSKAGYDKRLKHEHSEKQSISSDAQHATHFKNLINCHLCGKSFREAQYLSIHLRVHSGEKPHKCNICKKSFSQLGNVFTHMRTHSGEKPYLCDLCDKAFTCSGNRDSHRRTHTGEKPYMCDVCGMSFSRPNSLKMHRNLHTGDRPYPCDECNKAFVSSGKLVEHKRTHSGEKPYTCEICGLSFAIVNTLKRHKKIHSGEKSHSCQFCGKRFLRREGMRSHLKTHTGQVSKKTTDMCTKPTLVPDASNYKENTCTVTDLTEQVSNCIEPTDVGIGDSTVYNMTSSNYSARDVVPFLYNQAPCDKNDIYENSKILASFTADDVLNKYDKQIAVNFPQASNAKCPQYESELNSPINKQHEVISCEKQQNNTSRTASESFVLSTISKATSSEGCLVDNNVTENQQSRQISVYPSPTNNHEYDPSSMDHAIVSAFPISCPRWSSSRCLTQYPSSSVGVHVNLEMASNNVSLCDVPAQNPNIPSVHFVEAADINKTTDTYDTGQVLLDVSQSGYAPLFVKNSVHTWSISGNSNLQGVDAGNSQDVDDTTAYSCSSDIQDVQTECDSTSSNPLCLGFDTHHSDTKVNTGYDKACMVVCSSNNKNIAEDNFVLAGVVKDISKKSTQNIATNGHCVPSVNDVARSNENVDTQGHCIPSVVDKIDENNACADNRLSCIRNGHPIKGFCDYTCRYSRTGSTDVDACQEDDGQNTVDNAVHVEAENKKHRSYYSENYQIKSNKKLSSKECDDCEEGIRRMKSNNKDTSENYDYEGVYRMDGNNKDSFKDDYKEGVYILKSNNKDSSDKYDYEGVYRMDGNNKDSYKDDEEYVFDHENYPVIIFADKSTGLDQECLAKQGICKLNNEKQTIETLTQATGEGLVERCSRKDDENKITGKLSQYIVDHVRDNTLEDGEEAGLLATVESSTTDQSSKLMLANWTVTSSSDHSSIMKENDDDDDETSSIRKCNNTSGDCTTSSSVKSGSVAPVQCDVCSRMTSQADSLKGRRKKHVNTKQFGCTRCSKSFPVKYHSPCKENTTKQKLGMRLYTSPCKEGILKEMPEDSKYKTIKKAAGPTGSTGDVCPSIKSTFLVQHTAKNNSWKSKIKCAVCKMIFVQRVDLDEHLKLHPDHLIKCRMCGKEFQDRQYLKLHCRVHTKEKPYKCEECGKRFTQSGNYITHMRVHSGHKPYVCDVCNKAFTSSGNRDSHRRTHTGDKPYMCDVCGEKFSRPSSLTTHYRTHTGERPYRCDVCHKAFISSGKLADHCRIHTGEKPYTCEICGRSFAIVNTFRRHKRIHSGDRPHKCVICTKTFIRLEGLKSHLKTHTKNKSSVLAETPGLIFNTSDDQSHQTQKDLLINTDNLEVLQTYTNGNTDSLIVNQNGIDGYPPLCMPEFKHSSMTYEKHFNASQTTQYAENRETFGLQNQEACYYNQNIGSVMGTFVYPDSQGDFHHQT